MCKGGDKMIKCEVTRDFSYNDYEKIKDTIKRKTINTYGKLYVGDTFECNKDMADYLMGKNEKGAVVIKILEVEPEQKQKTKIAKKKK